MKRIAENIAQRLRIRTAIPVSVGGQFQINGLRYEYRDPSDDVKERFAELLAHTSGMLSFDHWEEVQTAIRQKPIGLGANNRLAEVFNELPPLSNIEEYAFPCETVFYVPFPEKGSQLWDFMSPWISPWIKAAMKEAENQ